MSEPTATDAAPSERWPTSAEDRADHARVAALITRVGWSRLHFSLHDVAAAMDEAGAPRLVHPRSLARHVALLPTSLVRRVDFRYSMVRGLADETAGRGVEDRGEAAAEEDPLAAAHTLGRPHYYYVLAERYDEHLETPRLPDEYERAYLALWVATLAIGAAAVPTNAVTDVARNVVELRLPEDLQTTHFLVPLLQRTVPLVQKESGADSGRWVRWRPLGERPTDPRFDSWLAAYRAAAHRETVGVHAAGSASLSELARRLVLHAIASSRSRAEWPVGRSVLVREIEAAAIVDAEMAALLRIVREGGRSLATVLSDAARPRIGGGERVHPRVVRLEAVVGSQTYYDVPDLAGYERRRLIAPLQALRTELTTDRIGQLARERRDAERLAAHATTDPMRAIASARVALVHDVLDTWEAALGPLVDARALLSKRVRAEVQTFLTRITRAREDAGSARESIAAADAALARVDLSWTEICAAARPLVTPDELAPWLPRAALERATPSLAIANFTTLRRHPRPARSTSGTSSAEGSRRSGRAVAYAVDRVDALVQLADRGGGRAGAALRAGARLLGPNLRDAGLVRRVLDDARERHATAEWTAALAALVLLGDHSAVAAAERALHDALPPVWHEHALYALLVLRSVDPARWPATVRFSGDAATRSVVQRVTTAARREQWLGG